MKWREVTAEENIGRRNYQNADYRDVMDGDFESSKDFNDRIDGSKKDQTFLFLTLELYQLGILHRLVQFSIILNLRL